MSRFKLEPYIGLLEAFVRGDLPAEGFEREYLILFKNDAEIRPEPVFNVLDRLFADVDSFGADAAIRGQNDIDETELRARSGKALLELKKMAK